MQQEQSHLTKAILQSNVHASQKEESAHRQEDADEKGWRSGWILHASSARRLNKNIEAHSA